MMSCLYISQSSEVWLPSSWSGFKMSRLILLESKMSLYWRGSLEFGIVSTTTRRHVSSSKPNIWAQQGPSVDVLLNHLRCGEILFLALLPCFSMWFPRKSLLYCIGKWQLAFFSLSKENSESKSRWSNVVSQGDDPLVPLRNIHPCHSKLKTREHKFNFNDLKRNNRSYPEVEPMIVSVRSYPNTPWGYQCH